MESKAELKWVFLTPRKARQVADEIRRKTVDQALFFLAGMRNKKKAVMPLEKLVKSALANFSVKNPNIDAEKLFVKELLVNPGPSHKRIRARAQGRAYRRLKRTCHFKVVISD